MNRSIWLAAIVILLAPVSSFAQMGGMGGQGMGGGMIPSGPTEVRRTAQVEMEGEQRLSGQIDVRPLTVQGDLGQYAIRPDKIKMIRFLKPTNEGQVGDAVDNGAVNSPQPVPTQTGVESPANYLGAANSVVDPLNPNVAATMTRGKIVTTSGQEIIGNIYIPADFKLQLDFGTLSLAVTKLQSITFTSPEPSAGLTTGDAAPPPAAEEASDRLSSPPRYFRHGRFLIVSSPVGDRITIYNPETKKSQTLELSGSKDAALEVIPILGKDILALALKGPKIARIAVADLASGTWHPQDLREAAAGSVNPVVAPGVAVYCVGRYAYAYSALAQRWDVIELPKGLRVGPVVGANGATIEDNGHIYSFIPKSGKWEHIDVRAILHILQAEPKK